MLNNVMPQRGTFFSLLSAHTERMVATANATVRLVSGLGNPDFDNAALIDEVNLYEKSADDIKHQLIKLLYESFTTPINRDQIHTLTVDLDRVVDSLQHVANTVGIYRIQESTPPAREMASLSSDACIRLNRAVNALATPERVEEVIKQCKQVDKIEARSAEVMRQAVTKLFANDGDEAAAWQALKMRDFYFKQEAVLDSCKRAAKTLEEILIENA